MFVIQLVLCFYVTMSLEKKQFFLVTGCVIQGNLKLRVFFLFFQVLALAIREVRIEAGAVLGNVQAFASKLVNAHLSLLHETSNFQTMTLQKKHVGTCDSDIIVKDS